MVLASPKDLSLKHSCWRGEPKQQQWGQAKPRPPRACILTCSRWASLSDWHPKGILQASKGVTLQNWIFKIYEIGSKHLEIWLSKKSVKKGRARFARSHESAANTWWFGCRQPGCLLPRPVQRGLQEWTDGFAARPLLFPLLGSSHHKNGSLLAFGTQIRASSESFLVKNKFNFAEKGQKFH